MIGGERKRAGGDRQSPLLVRLRAVSHSRWRHIGSHIVALSSVLGTVSDGLVRPFFVGGAADLRLTRRVEHFLGQTVCKPGNSIAAGIGPRSEIRLVDNQTKSRLSASSGLSRQAGSGRDTLRLADALTLPEGLMIFAIYAKETLIGHSALELGDPPMGVAFGKFIAAENYREIRRECQTNHADQSALALSVRAPSGDLIPCAGVGVLDYSEHAEDGEPAYVEATVLGIPYPLYGELFPEHVTAYEKQFSGR